MTVLTRQNLSFDYSFCFSSLKVDVTAESVPSASEVEEPPPIVDLSKTKILGNLDKILEEEKLKRIQNIEAELGDEEFQDVTQSSSRRTKKNVKIAEEKCVLYLTDDVGTIDEQDNNETPAEDKDEKCTF
ncbi:hypothetical protein AB6A40_002497 [Gnathostoma spinigerum]|uniref:Uncharacterized protein n=1 Tax=Gnathostoma spinigerum TaxID=75299 RepID=A0ABD6E6R1_9BILA